MVVVLEVISLTVLYDLSQLESISKGNNEFIDKMIALFLKMIPESIKEMKNLYQKNDFVQVSKVTHRIKPSIDNMGIKSLGGVIREIEKSADVYKKSEKLSNLINHLEETLSLVVESLKRE